MVSKTIGWGFKSLRTCHDYGKGPMMTGNVSPNLELFFPSENFVWKVKMFLADDVSTTEDCFYKAAISENESYKIIPLIIYPNQISLAYKNIQALDINKIKSFNLFYMSVCGAIRTAMRSWV